MNEQIIHIDTAKTWRGGQQQAAYLHEGLVRKGMDSLMVCPPDSIMESWCLTHQLPVQTLPLCCEADIFSAVRLTGLVRKDKTCILHAHNAHGLTVALMTKIFSSKKISIIASRRVDFALKNNTPGQWKYRTRLLSKIVCISHEIYHILLSQGIPEEKLIIIHSGVDIHKFDKIEANNHIRHELSIPENHKIVSTVAALTGHKDYPNFLEAARLVLQEYAPVTFIAVGDGKLSEEIMTLAEKKGLKNNVIFTGFRKDVGRILKSSDLFIMASKKEGMGTSILDAEAAGLPVIGTNAGGIPEVVRHLENGLIVQRQNPKALAEAVLTLLQDDKKRNMYGSKSLELVRDFDIGITIEKHITLYEKILKKY